VTERFVVRWERVSGIEPGEPQLFDVWLVPEAESSEFAFQSAYRSAAVLPVGDDAIAVAAWQRGDVAYDAPSLRVPTDTLDGDWVEEAVRRWARSITGGQAEVRIHPAIPRNEDA
jgi:hypothetical protein